MQLVIAGKPWQQGGEAAHLSASVVRSEKGETERVRIKDRQIDREMIDRQTDRQSESEADRDRN